MGVDGLATGKNVFERIRGLWTGCAILAASDDLNKNSWAAIRERHECMC